MPNASSGFERIAHRGASGEAPENTLPAVQLAVEKYGVDRVEVDLRLTRDGIPVVFHDAKLDRITNAKGPLSKHSLRELKSYDAGFWFDPQGSENFPYRERGVTIPTLEELLTSFPETNFCLEIKEKQRLSVARILEVIRRIPRKGSLLIGSFYGKIVRELRRSSSIESIFSQEEVLRAYLAFRLGLKKISPPCRYAFIPPRHSRMRLDQPAWIDFLHRNGVRVFYWTVNEVQQMVELKRRGADGILTDYPDRLNKLSKLRRDGSGGDTFTSEIGPRGV